MLSVPLASSSVCSLASPPWRAKVPASSEGGTRVQGFLGAARTEGQLRVNASLAGIGSVGAVAASAGERESGRGRCPGRSSGTPEDHRLTSGL